MVYLEDPIILPDLLPKSQRSESSELPKRRFAASLHLFPFPLPDRLLRFEMIEARMCRPELILQGLLTKNDVRLSIQDARSYRAASYKGKSQARVASFANPANCAG